MTLVRQIQLLVLKNVGSPFQFVCPLLLIDITRKNSGGEGFGKRFDPGCQ